MSGNMWADMINAQVFDKGNKLKVGSYDLAVSRLQEKDTFQHGLAFIAEFDIVTSTSVVEDMQPGCSASWYQGMSANRAVAMNMVFAFLLPLLGYDLRDPNNKQRAYAEIRPMTPHLVPYLISAANPASGFLVRANCYEGKAYTDKKTGEVKTGVDVRFECFDYAKWGVAPPDAQKLIADSMHYQPPPPAAMYGMQQRPAYGMQQPYGMGQQLPPPPPQQRVYPPGTQFHPPGTTPGNGAQMAWVNGAWQPC